MTVPTETAPKSTDTPTGPEPKGDDEILDVEQAKQKIGKANREAAALRKRVEEYEKAATEAETAKLGDVERLQREQATVARERDEARSEALRFRIGVRYALSEADLDLLGSGTEEEIENRAKRVAELAKGSSTPPPPATRRPVEQLRPGATPAAEGPADTSPRGLIAAGLATADAERGT